MEKAIKATAKLYEIRDTTKRFFGSEYLEKIKPHKTLIQAVMRANKLEEIPALLKIMETGEFTQNGFNEMMFIAATVELIEPSN